MKNARLVSSVDVEKYQDEDLRINYHGFPEFKNIALFFKIMDDEKVKFLECEKQLNLNNNFYLGGNAQDIIQWCSYVLSQK